MVSDNNAQISVIAVGYSAGGLQPLLTFFDGTPCDNAIYVVLNHMSPDKISYLQEILSKHSAMKVIESFDKIPIEKNKVYINSPGRYLTISDGHLRSFPRADFGHRINSSIDVFLESLSKIKTFKKAAVVFSGEGKDGAIGSALIKQSGGMVLVQDPNTCYASSMPREVIKATDVDAVLPPEKMPQLLLQYTKQG
jgi:chemotaxis response regulator CheB